MSWGIKSDIFAPKRVSHVRKFFDELSSDSRLESGEKRFQVEVFNTVIDITTRQLKTRFHSLQQTVEHFLLHKTQRYSGKECERTVGVVESSRNGVY